MKMNMKKRVAAVMMAVMAGSMMLTGCDGESTAALDESMETLETDENFSFAAEEVTLTFNAQLEESGQFTDSVDNNYDYRFRVPIVEGADTAYIQQVNAEMQEIIDSYITPELESMEDGNSMVTWLVDYKYSSYEGIHSMMLYMANDWGESEFRIYNFKSDGTQADNEDIFMAIGMSDEEFVSTAWDQINEATTYDPEIVDPDMIQYLDEAREKTLAFENLNDLVPIYVREDGRLYYIVKVYSVAGADYYRHCYIHPGAADFTYDELGVMAQDFYERRYEYRPEFYGVSAAEDEPYVDIQLYDQVDDHNATSDWFHIDANTGIGTDFFGYQVVLTEYDPRYYYPETY